MTPIARLARNIAQKIANSFYEGPQPPERLGLMVLDFANSRRRATRKQWTEFAQRLAAESYKSGYVRGFEATLRDDENGFPNLPPELLADALDPDWRWVPVLGPELENPHDFVDEEIDAAEIDPARVARGVKEDEP